MTEPIKYLLQPKFNNPALLVCWESDAGEGSEAGLGLYGLWV